MEVRILQQVSVIDLHQSHHVPKHPLLLIHGDRRIRLLYSNVQPVNHTKGNQWQSVHPPCDICHVKHSQWPFANILQLSWDTQSVIWTWSCKALCFIFTWALGKFSKLITHSQNVRFWHSLLWQHLNKMWAWCKIINYHVDVINNCRLIIVAWHLMLNQTWWCTLAPGTWSLTLSMLVHGKVCQTATGGWSWMIIVIVWHKTPNKY